LFGAEGTPTEAAILKKKKKKSLLLKGEDASSRNMQQ